MTMRAPTSVQPRGSASARSSRAAHSYPAVPWTGRATGASARTVPSATVRLHQKGEQLAASLDSSRVAGLKQVERDDGRCGDTVGMRDGDVIFDDA